MNVVLHGVSISVLGTLRQAGCEFVASLAYTVRTSLETKQTEEERCRAASQGQEPCPAAPATQEATAVEERVTELVCF